MKNERTARIFTIILAGIGLADALYLTWIKLSNTAAACLPGLGNCEAVNTSRYSEIMGVPVALLGAVAYIAILAVLLLEHQNTFLAENGVLLQFGISLAGVLYSAYLTYLEIAVIRAICPYCVVSAGMLTGIFVLTALRLFRNQGSPNT